MDINRGQVSGIVQWGLATASVSGSGFLAVTAALPITFPNVALFGIGTAAGALNASHIPVQVNRGCVVRQFDRISCGRTAEYFKPALRNYGNILPGDWLLRLGR